MCCLVNSATTPHHSPCLVHTALLYPLPPHTHTQSCAAWTERYREGITRLLLQHTSCSRVVWRPAVGILKEEGIDLESSSSSREQAAAAAAGGDADVSPLSSVAEGDSSSGSSPSGGDVGETVEVVEAGLTFLATPEAGQKTGGLLVCVLAWLARALWRATKGPLAVLCLANTTCPTIHITPPPACLYLTIHFVFMFALYTCVATHQQGFTPTSAKTAPSLPPCLPARLF